MIDSYYKSSYPSGADTLFGGGALLLRVPLIWAFQPFCAFMLAAACGPAWVLARAFGLNRPYAAGAALCATLGALVYGYELVGSVKEIVALGMILELGGLIAAPSNPGNLRTPLHWEQVFGVWLHGSYKQLPSGPARPVSYALIALALSAGVLGVFALWRRGRRALAAWLLLMPLVLVALDIYGTTWVDAKGLTITSPIVVLSAWAGIGALAAAVVRARALRALAAVLAPVLA